MKVEISKLYMASPLLYTATENPDPFNYGERWAGKIGREELYCFELDEFQYQAIEPDKDKLIEKLIFAGKAEEVPAAARKAAGVSIGIPLSKKTISSSPSGNRPGDEQPELPRGNYLFAQEREYLNKTDIITMAAELQQEALWQRLKPGRRLYLRFLYEDRRGVTQLFRPYS